MTSDDAATLIQIAKTDRDVGVRRLAIERITSTDVLAELAGSESDRGVRDFARERAVQLWMSHACGDDGDRASAALGGILKLGDQRALVDVVVRAANAGIRKRAFGELRDPKALADLARSEAAQDLRTAAVARIDDPEVLRALATDTTHKEVGLAAVDKLDDAERLDHVANKAKNKAVRQRARKIVTEIAEAERAKKPGVPDDVKRRRAEKAQLVRELEAIAETFEFAKASDTVKAAEAAWAKLPADDGDERFTKAVERFWRRKDLHEQQARSSDELRAVEREAAAEKERAAAERARAAEQAKPAEAAAEPTDEEPVDPKRAARDAEAKARREEREKARVEEDARRAAQAAERAARQKEDAERGKAIAASLAALCEDMEGLATQPKQDTRVIDRLLAQATKAFEQIGKVPTPDRDAVADRYRVARGKLATRAGELREAEDWQRWSNVPKAEALIATAKEMFEAEATPDLGNRLRGLQALWKEVGPMPQRRSKELWEQFKAACDQVYDKVRGVRAVEQEKFVDVIKVKEALIAEAEAAAESTEWGPTAEKLKALQAQWKQSGHLPRKQGDELWSRFRAACDKFFERRKPELEARRNEEAQNLAAKQALIARAEAVARMAPAEGGWGKSIGEIKDLQRAWKEIGFVPRRDADAVYKAFRAACDALFQKRDDARDSEANAHRAELDELRAQIAAVVAGGDDVVARAIAARAKATELGALGAEVSEMIAHVVATHADAVRGTELDPAQLRGRRDKLIARAEELLPKEAAAAESSGDIASQLKQAMRKNAFGALRFSGRDPVEVVDELRASWIESGPILDDADRAQQAKFDDTVRRVLDAAGASARPQRPPQDDGEDRGRRRREPRARASGELTAIAAPVAVAGAVADEAEPAAPAAIPTFIPQSAHDAITRPTAVTTGPVAVPVAPSEAPPSVSAAASTSPASPGEAALPNGSAGLSTGSGPADELDTGWDLGDEDPTASEKPAKPEVTTPSSSEMAGDGAVEGDGLDSGWD